MTHEELRELTGSYALGALTRDERRSVEAHLVECDECAAEVRALMPVAVALGRIVPQHDPPVALKRRVLDSVYGAGQRLPSIYDRPVAAKRMAAWPAWLAAAAAVVAAVGLGLYVRVLQDRIVRLEEGLRLAEARAASTGTALVAARESANEAQMRVAILSAPDVARVDLAGQTPAPRATARAYWSRSRGLMFTANDLPPLPAGKVYQLWVVTADAPVSAGLLRPDSGGRASITVATPQDLATPVAMAVTIEPEGGVPAPTGEKYLIGTPSL
jgi:anti-sigma-K factor RskA